METKKDYFAIAEKLERNYVDTMGNATKECVNLLGENDCAISLKENETDYVVTIYEGNRECSLRGAYIPAKGSNNIILSLYCYAHQRMYDTPIVNTDLNPTTLLLTLAAKVTDAFKVDTKKAKLVSIEVISRVIVDENDPEDVAIQRAFEKIAKDPMGYMCHDNVINVEDDDEMPYNPETDRAEVESYTM